MYHFVFFADSAICSCDATLTLWRNLIPSFPFKADFKYNCPLKQSISSAKGLPAILLTQVKTFFSGRWIKFLSMDTSCWAQQLLIDHWRRAILIQDIARMGDWFGPNPWLMLALVGSWASGMSQTDCVHLNVKIIKVN